MKGGPKILILPFPDVLLSFVKFGNFFVIFGGQTDRPTDLGIKAPSRSLKSLNVQNQFLIFV